MPESLPTAPRKPTGYYMTCRGVARQGEDGRPILSDKSDKSDKSDLSVAPPRHAYPRSHQAAKHTPAVSLRPSHTTQRQANPRGIPRHTHFSVRFRSFPYSSVFIVPRPRDTHTPAAITHTHACSRACALSNFFGKKSEFSAQNDLTK